MRAARPVRFSIAWQVSLALLKKRGVEYLYLRRDSHAARRPLQAHLDFMKVVRKNVPKPDNLQFMGYRQVRPDLALSRSVNQLTDSMPFSSILRPDPTFVLVRQFNCMEEGCDRCSEPWGPVVTKTHLLDLVISSLLVAPG